MPSLIGGHISHSAGSTPCVMSHIQAFWCFSLGRTPLFAALAAESPLAQLRVYCLLSPPLLRCACFMLSSPPPCVCSMSATPPSLRSVRFMLLPLSTLQCVCSMFSQQPPPQCVCFMFLPLPPCGCCQLSLPPPPPLCAGFVFSPPRYLPTACSAVSSSRPPADAKQPLLPQLLWSLPLHVPRLLLPPTPPLDGSRRRRCRCCRGGWQPRRY